MADSPVGQTVLYLDDEDMLDLEVVLDAADMVAEESRRVHSRDHELEAAVHNISTLAGIDMERVRENRPEEDR